MESELLSLKWNNHRTTFLHVIGTLRSKASYTDATLACDGKFYPVHKLVLSTCSEYFGAIFERTPCKSPVVVLKDIECKNLEFLLDYMYIGEVNVRQNELAALIKAAECLKIKGLAVPDEEPSVNSFSKNIRSDSQRESSPPAKRRRNVQSGSELEGKRGSSSETTIDNLGLEKGPSKDVGECPVDDDITPIKLEPLDDAEVSNFITNSNSTGVNNEKISDEGGGEGSKEDSTSDMKEFFGAKAETEESLHMSEYSSSDFAGPSGVQNSNLSQWDNENSFPMDHLLAGSSSTQLETQQQQQQQQQLLEAGAPMEAALRKYTPSAFKDCYVVLPPPLPQYSVTPPIRKRRKRGKSRWSRGKVSYRKTASSLSTGVWKPKVLPKTTTTTVVVNESETNKNFKYSQVFNRIKTEPGKSSSEGYSCNSIQKSVRKKRALPLKPVIKLEPEEDKETEDSNSGDSVENSEPVLKKRIFRCKYCPYTTKLRKWLIKHRLKKHNESSVPSPLKPVIKLETEADNETEDSDGRDSVENSEPVLKKRIFRCTYCPYTTKLRKWLIKHRLKKHNNESSVKQNPPSIEYSCPHCSSTHESKEELRSHINAEHTDSDAKPDIKPYACSQCCFCSTKIRSLKSHISYMHCDNGYRRKFECNMCFFSSNAKSVLRRHIQSRHSKEFSCSKCSYTCFSQTTLTEHELEAHPPPQSLSHNDYTYNCDYCRKTYSSEPELASHFCPMRPIKEEVDLLYYCKDCGFETDSRSVLIEHKDLEHSQSIMIKKVYSIKKEKEEDFID